MRMTQGALGFLCKRYAAVLKKCRLLNVFGSLAVAGMLVMGGAGAAGAATDLSTVTGQQSVTVDSEYTSAKIDTGATLQSMHITTGGKLTATGQIWGGDNTGTLYLDVTMDGGELFLDGSSATGTGGAALGGALEGKSVTISGGTVTITGNGTDGTAYLGSRNGLVVTGGDFVLNNGGRLYGGGDIGTQIDNANISMTDSSLWFGKTAGGTIGANASITVDGNSTMSLGNTQAVDNFGTVTVNPGATLNLNENAGDPATGFGELTTREGGTFDVQGTVNLTEGSGVRLDGGTVNVTGDGRILGNQQTGNDGVFSMAGGTLNIDATGSTTDAPTSIDVITAEIAGGTVNITGDNNDNSAYIGGYTGMTVSGDAVVNLDKGARLFGGGDTGTQLLGGTVNMGENSSIWFSKSGTGDIIAEGANVNVTGTGATIELSSAPLNTAGNISVAEGAELTFAQGRDGGQDAAAGGLSNGAINQTGGTISTAGQLTLDANTPLTVGDGATLQTVGDGFIQTEAGSNLTVAQGGTLDASAASAAAGGAIRGQGTASLEDGANVRISNAKAGVEYKLLSDEVAAASGGLDAAVGDVTMLNSSDFVGLEYDAATGTFKGTAKSASSVLPNLDGALGGLVTGMYAAGNNDLHAAQAGRRFLSRATDPDYGGSANSQTATIESAARIAAVSAVPQMTWAAQKAASAAVTQRTSLSAPASAGLQAVAADGSVQTGAAAGDAMKNGFAMWIMPLYQSWNAWGLEGGNLDMDVHGGLG
ncbi:MAG: hypothetical protein IJA79_04910, partial [Desulfovibrio sp.]|nr:hypothetical protein [Desulfovibrio sp.]